MSGVIHWHGNPENPGRVMELAPRTVLNKALIKNQKQMVRAVTERVVQASDGAAGPIAVSQSQIDWIPKTGRAYNTDELPTGINPKIQAAAVLATTALELVQTYSDRKPSHEIMPHVYLPGCIPGEAVNTEMFLEKAANHLVKSNHYWVNQLIGTPLLSWGDMMSAAYVQDQEIGQQPSQRGFNPHLRGILTTTVTVARSVYQANSSAQ